MSTLTLRFNASSASKNNDANPENKVIETVNENPDYKNKDIKLRSIIKNYDFS
jgi:hypothetical protein